MKTIYPPDFCRLGNILCFLKIKHWFIVFFAFLGFSYYRC
ncbi:hypothetical protein DCCM_3787 [Desulfocucumis palustris]|uniref:Uncharacterized protein n=1 Tax=Desulfocucumis palustris TaxID=1898651 RepID=A0A2L2XE91_9FIRM|nr:hypothetical protein DCCM_3787 [Desulfocucumis palustris]